MSDNVPQESLAPLWIGIYQDGAVRSRCNHTCKEHHHVKDIRARLRLPLFPWFRQLLVAHGGVDFDKSVLSNLESIPFPAFGSCRVAALAFVEPGMACVGQLTPWSKEAFLQHVYYGNPEGSYTVKIKTLKQLTTKRELVSRKAARTADDTVSKVSSRSLLFMPTQPSWPDAGETLLHRTQPDSFELDQDSEVQPSTTIRTDVLLEVLGITTAAHDIPVIMLPFPIVFLMARNAWQEILIPSFWHQRCYGLPKSRILNFPDLSHLRFNLGEVYADPPDTSDPALGFSAERCFEISRLLCQHAPTIIGGHQADRGHRARLVTHVRCLKAWAWDLWAEAGVLGTSYGQHAVVDRFKYDSLLVLECVKLAQYLKGGVDALSGVVERCLLLKLPNTMSHALLGAIREKKEGLIPSAALLRRYELSLDVAMMFLRVEDMQKNNDLYARFAWTDSSPTHGIDWLWSSCHEVLFKDLVPVFEAHTQLISAIRSFVAANRLDGEDTREHIKMEPEETWVQHLQLLGSAIREHINPPGASGAGHRGLSHKAGIEVYKWHLQLPHEIPLQRHARTYYSCTGDMGTEFSICRFYTSDPCRLLPQWVDRTLPRPDVDIDDASECQVKHGTGNSDSSSDFEAKLEAIVEDEIDYNEGVAKPLMENCLPVAGLQHIVSNMLADVHNSMSWWPPFMKKLKQFEALLRPEERRQRIKWTLLRNSEFEQYEDKFNHWSASLYEKRWHEVVVFLRKLHRLMPILCLVWDEHKFKSDVDCMGEARPTTDVATREAAGSNSNSKSDSK